MRLPLWARNALRPVTGRVPVPIISGVNRGLWWNLASAGSGYVTGRRTPEQMRFLASITHEGDCVWDVGAHHGYMTMCTARRVGSSGQVYAFEPSALNFPVLQRHLRWNGVASAITLQLALSDFNGETSFGGKATTKTMAIGAGNESVLVSCGSTLVHSGTCRAPTLMKIDVEGAEAAVLRGMGDCLPTNARLLIAVHSLEAFEGCRAVLNELGFQIHLSAALHKCLLQKRWRGDPDLLALGPDCPPLLSNPASVGYWAEGSLPDATTAG